MVTTVNASGLMAINENYTAIARQCSEVELGFGNYAEDITNPNRILITAPVSWATPNPLQVLESLELKADGTCEHLIYQKKQGKQLYQNVGEWTPLANRELFYCSDHMKKKIAEGLSIQLPWIAEYSLIENKIQTMTIRFISYLVMNEDASDVRILVSESSFDLLALDDVYWGNRGCSLN